MKPAIAAALLFAAASPGQAAVVLSDSFDAESPAGSTLNYTGFANFNVTGGSVDLIRSGSYGIVCAGGAGACVDLDGSTLAGGTLETKSSYAFAAGDLVKLNILVSGNQRGGASDEFSFGFNLGTATTFNNVVITGSFGAPVAIGTLGPGLFLGSGRPTVPLGLVAPTEPFTSYGISFVAGNAGTLTAFIATASTDNVGPVLDNFSLSIGAVPEPASWAMMITGFGLVGVAARSRRARTA